MGALFRITAAALLAQAPSSAVWEGREARGQTQGPHGDSWVPRLLLLPFRSEFPSNCLQL